MTNENEPRKGLGGVPIPGTSRGAPRSLSESHDDPSGRAVSIDERELFERLLLSVEARLEEKINEQNRQIAYLRSLIGSDRPGMAVVRSPSGWRSSAPAWVAISVAAMITVSTALWQAKTLWGLIQPSTSHHDPK